MIFFSSGLMFRVSVILISFHWQNKYCSICALLQSATEGLKHLNSGCQVVWKGTGKQPLFGLFCIYHRSERGYGSNSHLYCYHLKIMPKFCSYFFRRIYVIMTMNTKMKVFHALWQHRKIKLFFFFFLVTHLKMSFKKEMFVTILLRPGQMN